MKTVPWCVLYSFGIALTQGAVQFDADQLGAPETQQTENEQVASEVLESGDRSTSTYCPDDGVISSDPDLYPCLVVSRDKKSWHDALAVCEYHGGTLVKIESQKQQDYITSQQRNNKYTWFGMNDLDTEGEFIWVDRSPVTWFNWEAKSSQPNGAAEQNCTAINDVREWEDKECENTYFFICQMSATRAPDPNVFDPNSAHLADKTTTLKRPSNFNDIELLSRAEAGDESVCMLNCLYNPNCDSVAYGEGKTPFDCFLYRQSIGGYAPLWKGWNLYHLSG